MKTGLAKKIIGPVNWMGTWLALFLKEITLKGWQAALSLSLLILFILSPLPEFLPIPFIFAINIGLIAGFLIFSFRLVRRANLPTYEDILRQVEEANGLNHRPLRSINDQMLMVKGYSNKSSRLLWHQHQEKLVREIPPLSFGGTRPNMSSVDPYALRYLLLCLLVIFSTSSKKTFEQSLGQGLFPTQNAVAIPLTVDGWITAPDYTHKPPLVMTNIKENPKSLNSAGTSDLAKKLAGDISVPDGSRMTLQINGPSKGPQLQVNEGKFIDFEPLTDTSYRLKIKIEENGLYSLWIEDEVVNSWDIQTLPDFVPTASFKGAVTVTNRQSLKIPYEAHDDYGVKQIKVKLSKSIITESGGTPEAHFFSLVKSRGDKRDLSSQYFLDLTAHPWAGLQMKIELIAQDAIGQTGTSQAQILTLPQRVFNHPVARQIIAIRRQISASPVDNYISHSNSLIVLAFKNEAYGEQKSVFWGLNMVARRLLAVDKQKELSGSLDLLWKLALYLEEGEVSTALNHLQNAEKRLLEAMDRGAENAEIQQLLAELQQAMTEYLQAMAKEVDKKEQYSLGQPENSLSQAMMKNMNIRDMMDQLQDLLKMGMMDAARDLLAKMQDIMQNLRMEERQDLPKEALDALDLLHEIDAIMQQQQDLMERSFDRSMGRDPEIDTTDDPEEKDKSYLENAKMKNLEDIARQGALKERLEGLRQGYQAKMQDVLPAEIGESEAFMGQAKDSLTAGNNHKAATDQGLALDALQTSMQAMEKAFIEKFMNQGTSTISSEPMMNKQGSDPFGRSVNDPKSGSGHENIKIPSQDTMGRARSIQQELRQRFNDQNRDAEEKKYIERLLQPF